jgi:hypothetical protein
LVAVLLLLLLHKKMVTPCEEDQEARLDCLLPASVRHSKKRIKKKERNDHLVFEQLNRRTRFLASWRVEITAVIAAPQSINGLLWDRRLSEITTATTKKRPRDEGSCRRTHHSRQKATVFDGFLLRACGGIIKVFS